MYFLYICKGVVSVGIKSMLRMYQSYIPDQSEHRNKNKQNKNSRYSQGIKDILVRPS